jgi:hypothetical protein
MGQFSKESHQGERKKGGALGPWPRPARVRVWGPVGPHLPQPPPSPVLAAALGLAWGGGKVHPPPPI